MVDLAINDFFQSRKEAWLKKNIKSSMNEDEVRLTEQECDSVFSLEQWLPNAARRAGQISISTHPSTFSHPSSRKNKNGYVNSLIATSQQANDGFLRSGNVAVEADALGNAAALDVYKFLTIEMADGSSLLNHIEQDSEQAKALLSLQNTDYADLKKGFLAISQQSSESITSSKLKQVYFPVADGYHQLSLLTASGVSFELRKRLDKLRPFNEDIKEARACEKNNEFYEAGYKNVLNLTTIGYGGTKPQNISVLNNQNGGKTQLLISAPPELKKRDVQFPRADFFSQSVHPLRSPEIRNVFYALHALFVKHENNWELRLERDDYYQEIIDQIIQKMWQLRFVADTQFNASRSELNKTQKIWLLSENEKIRETESDWLDDLTKSIASFIFHGYEKVLKKKAFMFSDGELKHIHQVVVKAQESLR